MPSVFLSPSTQEYNPYITGGNEELYMNQIADAMQPLLDLIGIRYGRNNPGQDAAAAVEQSNAGNYDLHFAIHSNAAPPQFSGKFQGPIVFYYPGSENGRRAAEITKEHLREIYPNPSLPKTVASADLLELRKTTAPAAYVEIAYHDNPQDAAWIQNNIPAIADALVASIAEYFGVPYAAEDGETQGVVMLQSGTLNLREAPHTKAKIIGKLYNGDVVQVLRRYPGWYFVDYNGQPGYVSAQYVYLV